MTVDRGQIQSSDVLPPRHAQDSTTPPPSIPATHTPSFHTPPSTLFPEPSDDATADLQTSSTHCTHLDPDNPCQPQSSAGSFSSGHQGKAGVCFQCSSSPAVPTSQCPGLSIQGSESLSEGTETHLVSGQDYFADSSLRNVSRGLGGDSDKTTSSWEAHGQRKFTPWDQHSVRPASSEERLASQSPVNGGNQSGMSGVSMRRCRQWLGVCLPLAAFLYILLYCNSAVWSSFSLQQHPLHNTLAGSGFRKLLEDQEKARLSFNVSTVGLTQRLPSCIIIGVRKCGTRALLEFMDLHPDIVTAEDEMHFFSDDERYRLGLEWYRHLMPLSLPHQITMEKTPGYFISPISPSRVHRMNSSIKLIVLLRHPTTRTISDYTQIFYNKLFKNETLDVFEDIAIDEETGDVNTRYKAVQISMYHQHFKHWTDVFPRDQIHVVDGDRLITDPVAEIMKIEDFLGIEHRIDYSILYYNSTRGFYCMRMNATYERCLGASKGRKHPHIQQSVVRKLNKFFQPHNKKLFDLIQRKFPWS